MNGENEYWDLYTIDGRFVKTIERGSVMVPPDMYHEAVIIIPTDRAGHVLATKRSLTKREGGGLYEFPAGSALSGETPLRAARRELQEETGLKAAKMYKLDEILIPGIKRYIYLAQIDDLLNADIQLQKEETIRYRILTYQDWLRMIYNGSFNWDQTSLFTDKFYKTFEKMVGQPTKDEGRSAPELRVYRCELSRQHKDVEPYES